MLGFSGYEKPWDWKPEQKDDRPPAEYEKPWDKTAINLEAGTLPKCLNFTDLITPTWDLLTARL